MTSEGTSYRILDLVSEFQRYLEASTDLLPLTCKHYVYHVRKFAEAMGNRSLRRVSPEDLLEFHSGLRERGYAHGNINQIHSALKKFLQFVKRFREDRHAGLLLDAL